MDEHRSPTTQKRKKLNIPLIKGVIMMLLGILFGFLTALTGISPQIAAVPMIAFLLGFQPAKAQGTALAYSLCTAIGGIVGVTAGGLRPDYTVGIIVAFGATLGAILVARAVSGSRARFLMRLGQSLAILLAIYVLGESLRQRVGGPRALTLDFLLENRGIGAFVVGMAVGAVAQSFQVAMGILLVPALIYLAARPVPYAITTSLVVIGIASLLPTLGYAAKQAVDKGPGYWMCFGGTAGAFVGGMLLSQFAIQSVVPLVVFGLAAMILSGWALSRLA